MKRLGISLMTGLIVLSAFAQSGNEDKTLLWKINGNGLEKPSWLFGTIHMICSDDAVLSPSMRKVIKECDEVYFEVDMDNLFEMVGAIGKMKMKGDTTLKDLYNKSDYSKVKEYFENKSTTFPFSLLETFKPMLAASTLEQKALPCDNTAMMEQVIMQKAKEYDKKISGLETMAYQAGILDSIPYKIQAEQLLSYINSAGNDDTEDKQLKDMFKAYKDQDLKKLEELMIETDAGMAGFTDILLYHRNENWVTKLKKLMPGKSLLVAVGAGHLPGKKGVINLLRMAGYTVTPVENKSGIIREI
ncbi:MAG TPA: TraB/GumN family protein [Chitinophagaceae bacterium]|nr:TraB/GumN family protein [Chitinophagaceae bacterium]